MKKSTCLPFIFCLSFLAQAEDSELLSAEQASCVKSELAEKLKLEAISTCQEAHQATKVDHFDTQIEEIQLYTDLCSDDGSYSNTKVYFGRTEFLCHF